MSRAMGQKSWKRIGKIKWMHKVEECKGKKVASLLRYIDWWLVLRPWAHSLYNNSNNNNNNNLSFLFSSVEAVWYEKWGSHYVFLEGIYSVWSLSHPACFAHLHFLGFYNQNSQFTNLILILCSTPFHFPFLFLVLLSHYLHSL